MMPFFYVILVHWIVGSFMYTRRAPG